MPLVILGLIVVVGGCLLIYYQFGGRGLRGRSGAARRQGGAGDWRKDAIGAEGREAVDGGTLRGGRPGAVADSGGAEDKVLFLFGDGRREERPLRDEGDE